MLSAALASLMLFAPATFTTADAGGVRLRLNIQTPKPVLWKAPQINTSKLTPRLRLKVELRAVNRYKKLRVATPSSKPKLQLSPVKLLQQPRVRLKATVSK
jgi:hypothetical protein